MIKSQNQKKRKKQNTENTKNLVIIGDYPIIDDFIRNFEDIKYK